MKQVHTLYQSKYSRVDQVKFVEDSTFQNFLHIKTNENN